MTSYSTKSAKPCGKGKQMPLGSITDPELTGTLSGYKRRVASCYYSRTPDEIPECFPPGPLHVSPKIDGALWFLIFGDGEPYLASPRGRILVGKIPVIEEAAKVASNATGRTIIVGELFAAAAKKTRPRVGDLAKALGGEADADVDKLAFAAFDLVAGGDDQAQAPIAAYPDRLEVLRRILPDGKRVKVIRTEKVSGGDKVPDFYAEWVEGGKGEGLVARSADGRIFKIKPQINIDAAVIGYTERSDDPQQVRSLLLALMRRDGHFHLAGSCSVRGDDPSKELMTTLAPQQTPSRFRHANSSGALFRFVKPEMVVEVRVTDIQNEDSSGAPIARMVLTHDDAEGWTPVRKMPGASLLHPVLVRIRDDKSVNPTDIRIEQVLERVLVSEVDSAAEAINLPPSELLRREVYAKTTKGVTAVRKLVVWKTGKEDKDPDYPAYVVHWTDYSPSRKEPLKKEAKLAPTEDAANAIVEQMLKNNIKKGWEKVQS